MESELVDPEYRDAVGKAVAMLGGLGASVEEVSVPLTRHGGALTSTTFAEWSSIYRDTLRGRLADIDHNNRIRFLTGSLLPAQAYYKAQKIRTILRQQVLEALERVDVLVLPTGTSHALPMVSVPGIQSKEQAAAGLSGRISFTGHFSLASVPALSVPCGFTSSDLPVGLQIVGRPFAEDTVMKVAHAYQQHTAWHTRSPPI